MRKHSSKSKTSWRSISNSVFSVFELSLKESHNPSIQSIHSLRCGYQGSSSIISIACAVPKLIERTALISSLSLERRESRSVITSPTRLVRKDMLSRSSCSSVRRHSTSLCDCATKSQSHGILIASPAFYNIIKPDH